MNAKEYWEKVYRESDPTTDVSWFQAKPLNSIRVIEATGIDHNQPVIDIGGGASSLVDCLLDAGLRDITVVDISAAALEYAKARLGARAESVKWIEADVTRFNPPRRFQLWHDRAVFHFLTDRNSRQDYVQALKAALAPDGWFIIASFAKDGPTRCSGLPVTRHDAESLQAELGREFQLVTQLGETHVTPWNTEQAFAWFCFRRMHSSSVPTAPG